MKKAKKKEKEKAIKLDRNEYRSCINRYWENFCEDIFKFSIVSHKKIRRVFINKEKVRKIELVSYDDACDYSSVRAKVG